MNLAELPGDKQQSSTDLKLGMTDPLFNIETDEITAVMISKVKIHVCFQDCRMLFPIHNEKNANVKKVRKLKADKLAAKVPPKMAVEILPSIKCPKPR